MTRAGRGESGVFAKGYTTPQSARAAMLRSRAARAAGVQTPAVLAQADAQTLHFARIMPQGQASVPQMLRALGGLWAMPDIGLARFDPFLRIRPRLPNAPAWTVDMLGRLQAQDRALSWRADRALHGDFHPGQVLRDAAGMVWLIDLDDMALGPPEADLGNLAAWMATQSPGDLVEGPAVAQVLALAPLADASLVAHFCAIALMRRALKLAEKGQPWVLEQLALRA